MTEQRFDIIYDCQGVTRLIDRENKLISLDFGFDWNDLDDYEKDRVKEWLVMLNEQQDIITELEKSNDEYRIATIKDIELMEQAEKKIGEQQATIRKLQDLCGESDSENAKLRIENKKLKEEIKLLKPVNIEQYEQIVQLQEENKQLRQSRDYWSKKTKEHIYYWNCLEKAIEKVFDSDDQCFDEIWKHYDEMEAKWEDEE